MKSEKIVNFCAILVSVIALTVSIWQGVVTREHNRLSVKPNFLVTPMLEGKGGKNGIYISNAGLGPGIITGAKLIVNNEEFDFKKNVWPDILIKLGVAPICFATSWLPNESALMASEEKSLISITRADLGACYLEVIKLVVKNKINVEVRYKSMYGEVDILSASATISKDDFNFSKMFGINLNTIKTSP